MIIVIMHLLLLTVLFFVHVTLYACMYVNLPPSLPSSILKLPFPQDSEPSHTYYYHFDDESFSRLFLVSLAFLFLALLHYCCDGCRE